MKCGFNNDVVDVIIVEIQRTKSTKQKFASLLYPHVGCLERDFLVGSG
jgi:hypothetical protein